MKTIRILALHLAYGGVEKAIVSMANLFVEKYDVEIICVYNMPGSPAFPLDSRVKLRYLLDEVPNREQWKDAVHRKAPVDFVRESIKSVRVLLGKKLAVINTVKSIHDGILITTRHEDNLVLSKYGDKNVLKIAQLHHDHNFMRKYVRAFERDYGNIDVFALLGRKLRDEVRSFMKNNTHTRVVHIPNFLERIPEHVDLEAKEKVVIAVGRLEAVKGFSRLISMFVKVHDHAPGWELHIVGEGSERGRLETMIADNDAGDYIKLLGMLDSKIVEEKMKSASIYAMTSLSEGLPFVIIEAQTCYLPTVAFDVRVGPGVLLENEKTGFLVADGDEDAYIGRLLQLINSKELRTRMGTEARRNSLFYSRENVADIWFSVLEEKND